MMLFLLGGDAGGAYAKRVKTGLGGRGNNKHVTYVRPMDHSTLQNKREEKWHSSLSDFIIKTM
jgi:hypothetical protein